MTVNVRKATKEDVAQIVHLLADDPIGQEREAPNDSATYCGAFEAMMQEGLHTLLVATKGVSIIGYLQLTCLSGLSYQGAKRGLIEDVRVAQTHRSKGIGRLLMQEAERIAKHKGCTLLELFVHTDRSEAHEFYAACGYQGTHCGFRKPL